MRTCPVCRQPAFDGGRCAACGHEDVPILELDLDAIVDEPEPLSLDALTPLEPEPQRGALTPLPLDALVEVEEIELEDARANDDPIPLIEGFEATDIEPRAPRSKKGQTARAKETTPFVHSVCPQCQAPVAQPNPPFCEACGCKLVSKRRAVEPAVEDAKHCGECGTRNGPDRSTCRNCGARLKSAD